MTCLCIRSPDVFITINTTEISLLECRKENSLYFAQIHRSGCTSDALSTPSQNHVSLILAKKYISQTPLTSKGCRLKRHSENSKITLQIICYYFILLINLSMLKSSYHEATPQESDIHSNTNLRIVPHGQLSPHPIVGQTDVTGMIIMYCERRKKHVVQPVALWKIS
jgi:hypothetical protein